ncbi:MAG: TrkA family potassium uptake protein [Deltaproteobacteria bacterium]|nr:TrkA family potassium uptake protein [Deltaproteobacteria bacterium]
MKPKETEKNWPQYVVVVGCGRLGSHLASKLSQAGSNVVVIDCDESAFAHLAPEFSGFCISGDAVQVEVLQKAKVSKADCLLAVTPDDNLNLMVAQVAHEVFAVPKVMARVSDTKRESVYRKFGIATVSPTRLAVDFFLGAFRKTEGNG